LRFRDLYIVGDPAADACGALQLRPTGAGDGDGVVWCRSSAELHRAEIVISPPKHGTERTA